MPRYRRRRRFVMSPPCTRGGDRVQLTLRMRVPNLVPLVLPSAREETQGLALLAFLAETAKAFARLGITLGAAQSDALELARFDVVRLELACAFEDIQRVTRAVQPNKRARRCAQRLEFEYAVRRLLGEHKNVAGPLLAPRHLDTALPRLRRGLDRAVRPLGYTAACAALRCQTAAGRGAHQ
jgi:hypothetical protein